MQNLLSTSSSISLALKNAGDDSTSNYCQPEQIWCWLALGINFSPFIFFLVIIIFRHQNSLQNNQYDFIKNSLLCPFSYGTKTLLCFMSFVQATIQAIASSTLENTTGWAVSLQINATNCIWILFVYILIRKDRQQIGMTTNSSKACLGILTMSQLVTFIIIIVTESVNHEKGFIISESFIVFLLLFLNIFIKIRPSDFINTTSSKEIKKELTEENHSSISALNTPQQKDSLKYEQESSNKRVAQQRDENLSQNQNIALNQDIPGYQHAPLYSKQSASTFNFDSEFIPPQFHSLQDQIIRSSSEQNKPQDDNQFHLSTGPITINSRGFSFPNIKKASNLYSQDNQLTIPQNIIDMKKQNDISLRATQSISQDPLNVGSITPNFPFLNERPQLKDINFSDIPNQNSANGLSNITTQTATAFSGNHYQQYQSLKVCSFTREERFGKRTVLFKVSYIHHDTNELISMYRSYREFSDLRKGLQVICKDLKFDPFPKKLEKKQLSIKDLQERTIMFDKYLKSVVEQVSPSLPILKSFLSPSHQIFEMKAQKKQKQLTTFADAILEDSNDCSCSQSQKRAR